MSNYYKLFPRYYPLHDTKIPKIITSEQTRIKQTIATSGPVNTILLYGTRPKFVTLTDVLVTILLLVMIT